MTEYKPPHLNHSVTYRLHLQREALGYTDEYCEAHANISVYRWGRYKKGIGKLPDADELRRLAKLGFDLNYVMTGTHAVSAAEKALLENYRASNEAGQKALRQVGSALAQSMTDSAAESED